MLKKNISLEDFDYVSDEELFAELTSEQAAAIEGGYFLYLKSLECFKEQPPAWAGSDEISVRVNGKQVAYNGDMDTGEFWTINQAKWYDSPVTVSIYEKDGWLNPDDFVGAMYVSGSSQANTFQDFTGNSSYYRLTYSVFG